jgi:hypothetical protein
VARHVEQQVGLPRDGRQLTDRQPERGLAALVNLAGAPHESEPLQGVAEDRAVNALFELARAARGVDAPARIDVLNKEDIVAELAQAQEVMQPVPHRAGHDRVA